jgi:ribosomal protein S18 acetylase RimI-like enzyme
MPEPVKTPAGTSAALRAEANMCRSVRALALAAVGGEIEETPELLVSTARAPLRSFNQIIVKEPLERGSEALSEAVARYQRPGSKFRLRARSGLGSETAAAILAAGLVEQGGIPSLAAEISAAGALENGVVEITRVADAPSLADHVLVVAEAFGWTPEELGQVFTPRLLEDEAWRCYVGYVDGEPAATSQLVVYGGVAGLYYVGTRDCFRRRGLGEALTRHAMREGAAAGCDIASLQASPAGYPVYVRIGFRDVEHYTTYVNP